MRYFTFFTLLLLLPTSLHTFHVSKCELQYVPKTKTVQIALHIFIDDLELGLKKSGVPAAYIGTKRETATANAQIAAYVTSRLTLQAGKNVLLLTMIGKEMTKDMQAVYVYLEAKSPQAISTLTVNNQLLTEVFADQKNIVETTFPNGKLGLFTFTGQYVSDKLVF